MNILLGVVALMSVIYYCMIVSYAGIQASFSGFWLILGILAGVLAVLLSMKKIHMTFRHFPLWVKVPLRTTIVLGILCFAAVEGFIMLHMFSSPEEPVDYLIVLGAQVRGDTVTKSLKYRLDTAADYLGEHPDTRVIVTGGKGPGENISEAAAMRNYLMDRGIDKKRIVLERYATNTVQNLLYSKSLLVSSKVSVGVVTNSFHVFRSVSIARKLGMENVTGIAAESDKLLLPNYMVREFFAVVKDKFLGNI
ncbi:YdcF family protein [Lacrimispora sp. NSJ-141]|uniref:YdcF family protein n=1 Tax=Lientehia hominis TaxID=2897778 RepID=A0AAP2RFU0_9FIRM|nr:YdcF family protein [Lientehia hominis]MCD2491417.1 YdcF family protein [Lientehia hominis]